MRNTLSPAALRAQADGLAHEAYRLRRKAEVLEAAEEHRARAREVAEIVAEHAANADLRTTPEKMAEALRADLAELIPWITADVAAATLKAELGRATRYARAMRDREIMRLARLGWTNAEIAAHPFVGLRNPKSVSRIVQRTLKALR